MLWHEYQVLPISSAVCTGSCIDVRVDMRKGKGKREGTKKEKRGKKSELGEYNKEKRKKD